MNKVSLFLCTCAALAAAGCQPSTDRTEAQQAGRVSTDGAPAPAAGDPVQRGAEKVTQETLPENLAVSPAPRIEDSDAEASGSAPAPTIPDPYRGSWGMVPADCTSTRGDAKGLMRVGERAIRFYESTATLKEQRPAIATSFSGLFAFTGEGQTWEKVVTLTRSGDRLTRSGEDGTFTYTRCAS